MAVMRQGVAERLDLPIFSVLELPMEVGQGEKDHAEVFGRGFETAHAKVRQAQTCFQIQVIDFHVPAVGAMLQYLLSRQIRIGRQEVRAGFLPGVPFGEEDQNLFAKAFEAASLYANPVFRGRVRGAHVDSFQALVPDPSSGPGDPIAVG